MRHLTLLTLTCSLFTGFSQPAPAIVWSDPSLEPPTHQTGVLKHTGRMLYTRFHIFGGTCIWIGGPWVLTARHGVEKWSPSSLAVDFPAHGKQNYRVQSIHLSPDKKVDLALLRLQQTPPFTEPITLDATPLAPKEKIRFGGYGNYGSAGDIAGAGRFHWGTNTLDSVHARIARFSLSKSSKSDSHEATAAIFDSGSPVFRTVDNQSYLAGIIVRATQRTSPNLGARTSFTCLAEQSQWIKQVASDLSWRNNE